MDAIIPFGDTIAVLTHGGTPAAAFGIHAATGVAEAVAGILLLCERPLPITTTAPTRQVATA
ncbi:hypothetical protein ACH347_23780 [Saccharopolyspora sp. 5N102]|uniref:hypothetical protein n=1 Tax=Saccharopolyspora sp. 5N102 TaxID=3375155 RepID=UPI00379DED81